MKKTTLESERELLLSDPIICAVLEIEAESVGVKVEEYCDCFLQKFYSNPKIFGKILNKT